MKTVIIVKGFHCKSCEALVKDVASDFEQIKSCNVDIKTGKVELEHASGFNINEFIKEVESLGDYKVQK